MWIMWMEAGGRAADQLLETDEELPGSEALLVVRVEHLCVRARVCVCV